jgi:hypothetical protein
MRVIRGFENGLIADAMGRDILVPGTSELIVDVRHIDLVDEPPLPHLGVSLEIIHLAHDQQDQVLDEARRGVIRIVLDVLEDDIIVPELEAVQFINVGALYNLDILIRHMTGGQDPVDVPVRQIEIDASVAFRTCEPFGPHSIIIVDGDGHRSRERAIPIVHPDLHILYLVSLHHITSFI